VRSHCSPLDLLGAEVGVYNLRARRLVGQALLPSAWYREIKPDRQECLSTGRNTHEASCFSLGCSLLAILPLNAQAEGVETVVAAWLHPILMPGE